MTVVRETGAELDRALGAIVARAAELSGAEVVVARLADDRGKLVAHAVYAASESVRAELESSWIDAAAAPEEEETELEGLPGSLRVVADRLAAAGALRLPVHENGAVVGTLELLRARSRFDSRERAFARAAAHEVALARRAFVAEDAVHSSADPLELAGDALAATADETQAGAQVAALAAGATGAAASLLWTYETAGPVLAASAGPDAAAAAATGLSPLDRARRLREAATVERLDGPWEGVVTLQLGEPPLGALQLLFPEEPSGALLPRLATFAVRAAHALRVAEQRRFLAAALERTHTLLTIVSQAIAELSLAHTLETAVDRVRELLEADRLAVYLLDGERLDTAAERGLTGPHVRIGERLLALALGPAWGRGFVEIPNAEDERLDAVRDALEELGIEAALAVPLRAVEDVIGLLAVYPARGRTLTENEQALLGALAAQLAVAVQNAQLHEKVERESAEAKRARDEALAASRRLHALYEISRSVTESASLKETFEAIVETVVDVLEVDAAVLRMPHERGDSLVPAAVHVRDRRLEEPLRTILSLPQPVSPLRPNVFRSGEALTLDPDLARSLGSAHEPLAPFLERGSSAAVIPLATQEEILGTLTLVSLDADRPIGRDTLESAISIAGPAALALENARLHQEREAFAETMVASLLPQTRPQLAHLEIGDVYEPSALVDIGGDVYDFLELADGRLAVVLGDVTGHGIDAAADMALAKFVFRSIAREHPEPGEFLAAANEIVLGEVETAKFITLLYVIVDPRSGDLACASAGHPPLRIVNPRGVPEPVDVSGLALGIESGQSYKTARVQLESGAAAVLYTDGLVEARREGELYGERRLDAALARNAALPAGELAKALVADCRAFAGELSDDLAVVVLRRV